MQCIEFIVAPEQECRIFVINKQCRRWPWWNCAKWSRRSRGNSDGERDWGHERRRPSATVAGYATGGDGGSFFSPTGGSAAVGGNATSQSSSTPQGNRGLTVSDHGLGGVGGGPIGSASGNGAAGGIAHSQATGATAGDANGISATATGGQRR